MRISFSGLQKYLNCRYEFFLHYFRKLRSVEERSSLVFGSAIDSGLNTLLETRDLNKALGVFNTEWDKHENNKNIQYSKADLEEHLLGSLLSYSKANSWQSLKVKGNIFLKEYNEQVMPKIKKVIKVQLDEVIPNDSGDELVIKTDFICEWEDGKIILFDNKTSSVNYAEDSVRKSEQLAIYYEMLHEKYKITHCGYIVIPKATRKKKLPVVEIKIIIDKVDESTIESTFKSFETALNGIKDAKFEKNLDNCINKYGKCTYYNLCHGGSLKGLSEK
jgi:hypothetical protein